jgi:hypothetical protein
MLILNSSFSDKNWEALTSHLLSSDESKSRYFINICGDVLKSNLTNKCPEGAAACSIGNLNISLSSFHAIGDHQLSS